MENQLFHHGIKGQKWGVRRYQNSDGSYTKEGKTRYTIGNGRKTILTGEELEKERHRLDSRKAKDSESVVVKAVKSGEVKLEIHQGRQDKHIKGRNNYTKGKSYLYEHIVPSLLIKDLYGTGEPVMSKGKAWMKKENVFSSVNIGVDVNEATGEETPTNKLTIHYSKYGAHAVPTYPFKKEGSNK